MVWTIAQIDRAVFHAIRKQIVSAGYLPDILLYQPSNPTNKTLFEAAKAVIVTSGKQIIDIVNVGDNSHRDGMYANKIIVDRDIPRPSSEIGYFGNIEFTPNGDPDDPGTTFTRGQPPAHPYFITYEITYVTTSTEYDRILESIIRKALTKTYLYGIDDAGAVMADLFNFTYNSNPLNMRDEKYIERMYKFTAGEVILDENTVDERTTSTIVQITDPLLEPLPVSEITDDLFEQSS